MTRILIKKEVFIEYNSSLFMLYVLHDISSNKFSVAMANSIISEVDMQFSYLENMLCELIQEEIKKSYMDWFTSIQEAIDFHFQEFMC